MSSFTDTNRARAASGRDCSCRSACGAGEIASVSMGDHTIVAGVSECVSGTSSSLTLTSSKTSGRRERARAGIRVETATLSLSNLRERIGSSSASANEIEGFGNLI